MSVSSDVGNKLLAWMLAGTGTLLAYSAYKNRAPWDVLRDINGPPLATATGTGTAAGFTGSNYSGSIPRLRQIANREIPPTLVAIQPCGQLDMDAAASKARIDTKLGKVIPAASCNDAYRSFAIQAQAASRGETINGKPRFADPNKGLHVVGLAFDIHSDFNNADVYQAFREDGWHQTRPIDEPWHWSYGVRG